MYSVIVFFGCNKNKVFMVLFKVYEVELVKEKIN